MSKLLHFSLLSHCNSPSEKRMVAHQWLFAPRFRCGAFGWRSQLPMQRIKEAVSEIRKVARQEPVLAAEGAILLLEKLSPALTHVDSSSGAIGSAVNRAIEALVPIIIKPAVAVEVRQAWLERLWQALQEDAMPYIEYLGTFWGELCVTPTIASSWADELMPVIHSILASRDTCAFFAGTIPCFSALYAAKRYEELLSLLESERFKLWDDRTWGVKALMALNKQEEALHYLENTDKRYTTDSAIAQQSEAILLSMGRIEEAYQLYAHEANQRTTYLATFRAIAKEYPDKLAIDILRDLIAHSPGSEGKWFAAAKTAGFFDIAVEVAHCSPTDPHTLLRAAKEFALSRPDFAMACGLVSLHWMVLGYGYDLSSADVLAVYRVILEAAQATGIEEKAIQEKMRGIILQPDVTDAFVKNILKSYLVFP